jgi:anti-sigma factor RsiW
MCEFSKKLIALMDGELLEGESAELHRHLGACAECRNWLAKYERTSDEFDSYCEATFTAESWRKSSRLLPAAVAVGTAAAVIASLLIMARQRLAQLPPRVSPPIEAAHVVAPPPEPPVMAANRVDAAHHIDSSIHRGSRQHVGSTVPRGPDVEHEPAFAALQQSSQLRNPSPFPQRPSIEIAIPVDAMFPPGAVPPGMSFTGELTIAADGSPEQLGLRPRLAGFERSKNQP